MQMPALLFAILLAGGNPVWDQQPGPNQARICSEMAAAAAKPAVVPQSPKARRALACPAGARPLAEAAPSAIQAR